jgi:hypothetical protein
VGKKVGKRKEAFDEQDSWVFEEERKEGRKGRKGGRMGGRKVYPLPPTPNLLLILLLFLADQPSLHS